MLSLVRFLPCGLGGGWRCSKSVWSPLLVGIVALAVSVSKGRPQPQCDTSEIKGQTDKRSGNFLAQVVGEEVGSADIVSAILH